LLPITCRPCRQGPVARWRLGPTCLFGSGDRIRTYDLRVMSPASYRTAPPRVADSSLGYDILLDQIGPSHVLTSPLTSRPGRLTGMTITAPRMQLSHGSREISGGWAGISGGWAGISGGSRLGLGCLARLIFDHIGEGVQRLRAHNWYAVDDKRRGPGDADGLPLIEILINAFIELIRLAVGVK